MEEKLIEKVNGLNLEESYDKMSKDDLIERCQKQNSFLKDLIENLKLNSLAMLDKRDIMDIYHCESNKALKILKVMFFMGFATKVGKEYYVSRKSHDSFVEAMAGKEVFI